jgi:serine/threonine protein kinase
MERPGPPNDDPDRTLPVGDDATIHMGSGGAPSPTPAGLPASIGNYTIVGKLGEGGMGVVYEAEQQSPKRPVALKVIRGGSLVTDLSVKMFQREAETLGRLKHPGIAAIYESGRTEEGQHFFAMELVRGAALDEHVGSPNGVLERREIRERLELFRKICEAVNYAHQRGVIHRDLKPANILIGADGEPRILDFGLARITDADAAARSMATEVGLIKGTLRYMSPEQTRGNPDDIDVRTDVYTLGVILYQLLSGRFPYDTGQSSIVEAARVIQEQRPAAFRAVEATRPLAGGDLETIVGKALEKEPDERYPSAVALSDDIERYLTDQPIQARPPSTMYQLRKLVSRNRLPTALAAAVLLLLIGLTVTMGVLRSQANAARREAESAREDVEAVADFQARMLSDLDPETIGRHLFGDLREKVDEAGLGPDASSSFASSLQFLNPTDVALEVLDADILTRAEEAVESEFGERPGVRGRLEHSLGRTAFALGLYDRAAPLLQQATRTYDEIGDPVGGVRARTDLARVHVYASDWGKTQEALEDARAAAARVADPSSPEALQLLSTEGIFLLEQHEWMAADSVFALLADRSASVHGKDDLMTMTAQEGRAYAWSYLERYDEAEAVYRDLVARARALLGDDNLETMTFINNAAQNYVRMGRYDEALELYREGLEKARRIQGSEHSDTHISVVNLGRLYTRLGRYHETEELGREALRIAERTMSPKSIPMAMSHGLLAEGLLGQSRFAEAEPHLRAAYGIFVDAFGPESGGSIAMSQMMVEALQGQGKTAELDTWKERAQVTPEDRR